MLQLIVATCPILCIVSAHTMELDIYLVFFCIHSRDSSNPSRLCINSFTKYENQDTLTITVFIIVVRQALTIQLWPAWAHKEQPPLCHQF